MSKYNYNDMLAAGSGSGYGCYCPKNDEQGGLGDLGLYAAGAAAVFLLYQAITMMARRKKRSAETSTFGAGKLDLLYKGKRP